MHVNVSYNYDNYYLQLSVSSLLYELEIQVLLLTHLLERVYVCTHTDVPVSMSSLLY